MRKLPPSRRSGVVLICVLACIVVVTSLVATSLMSASRTRREARTYQQMSQVKWLLDLGVRRAQHSSLAAEGSPESLAWSDPAWPDHELNIRTRVVDQANSESDKLVQVQASMKRIGLEEATDSSVVNETIRRSFEFRLSEEASE